MTILLDTNILLRLLQPHSAHGPIAERAVDALHQRNEALRIAAQNLERFRFKCLHRSGVQGGFFLRKKPLGSIDSVKIRSETAVVEVWAVATRPVSENGLGLPVEQAMEELLALKRLFTLLPEAPLQGEWERLVAAYGVRGKNSYDARLVAAMVVQGVSAILTFNVQDFARYSEIAVLDPRSIA